MTRVKLFKHCTIDSLQAEINNWMSWDIVIGFCHIQSVQVQALSREEFVATVLYEWTDEKPPPENF